MRRGAVIATEQSIVAKALAGYSAYGWRARIGVVVPSTNTTLEPEFARMAGDGIAVHASRILQFGGQEAASYRRMSEEVAIAASLLATAEVDVVALGCTSCSYFVPPDVIKMNMLDALDCPVVLAVEAVVEALRVVNAARVALVGPRTPFVTEREIEFLSNAGFDVVASACLGLGATEEERRAIGRLPPQALLRLAMAADHADADALVIGSTQLPTLVMIEHLEKVLNKPVITPNQATFWCCLRRLGVRYPVENGGQLGRMPIGVTNG